MAIYHCSVKVGSRSGGKSAVASDAYREEKKLTDERTGEIHDYSKKRDVVESLTLTPENAPTSFSDSSVLWNEVEKSEKRKDAQLFREVEVSLPRELSHEQNKALTLEYVNDNFVIKGMCATVSFHESKSDNPHAHIMLTTRAVDRDGFRKKERSWNDRKLVEEWRASWAEKANKCLEKNNIDQKIDHRSFERQGLDKQPTVHLGPVAHEMEKRGQRSERGDINREVERQNSMLNKPEQSNGIADGITQARLAFEAHKAAMERQKKEQAKQKMAELKAQRSRTEDRGMSR